MDFFAYIRGYLQRPLVRPWALAGPVLILMICLPLLRPLRQPNPTRWHDEEQMIAATVQAIVEHRTLAIDESVFADNPAALSVEGHRYSPYSPMLPLLLAPFYWLLLKQNLFYSDNLIFVQYVLTLIGSCIPVALCVGLVYRLARMFELRRALRVSLGIACVICGGLISYGVVLNRHCARRPVPPDRGIGHLAFGGVRPSSSSSDPGGSCGHFRAHWPRALIPRPRSRRFLFAWCCWRCDGRPPPEPVRWRCMSPARHWSSA